MSINKIVNHIDESMTLNFFILSRDKITKKKLAQRTYQNIETANKLLEDIILVHKMIETTN